MNSFKKLVLFLVAGSLVAATSCKKDETQGTPNLAVTASTHTAAPGDVVDIAITTSAGGSGKITTLKIEEITSGTSGSVVLLDSAVNQNNYGYTYEYHVPNNASGTKEIKVSVTDNLGQTNSKTETITIAGSSTVKSCGNATLGSYNNTTGSFFGTKSCSIYTVAEARNNQAAVDFIYFYGSSNNATLAAPDDQDVNTINTFDLSSWSTKNATRFKMITGFDYTNATSASIITAWTTATGVESSKANNLGAGQMVAFKTADGRYGVVKVNSITPNADGKINISVKSTM